MPETKIVGGREYIIYADGEIGKRVIRLKDGDYCEWQNMGVEELRREHKLLIWLLVIAGISFVAGELLMHNSLLQFFIIVVAIAIYMCLAMRWIHQRAIDSKKRKRGILAFYESFQNVPPEAIGSMDQSKDPNITFVVLSASEDD